MKYALAISATKEQFTAAYVSVYSFRKQHPDAAVLLFGDSPDMILTALGVHPVELTSDKAPAPKNLLYTNNLSIGLSEKYDAFIVAKYDVLYNKSLKDLVVYAIQSRHVLGSTTKVGSKLGMNSTFYIVPSNAVNNKIRGTVFGGINKDEQLTLIDAYYPILIDMSDAITLTVGPGVSVEHTDKRIIHYADDAWKSTPANDLWTKIGEEFIENIDKNEENIHLC